MFLNEEGASKEELDNLSFAGISPGLWWEPFARELSLEEALAFALENNRNLRSAYEELQRQEKNLEDPVQLKWQVDLGANYSQDITGDKQPKPGNSSSNAYSINISADKSYLSGLRLSPGLNIKEGGDPSFSINITKSLYPLVPTDLARGIYKGELELIKARRNFAASKVSALLSWIETYFNLERMNSRLEIYQQNLQKAETNLERVLAREEIGDAGENDILLARLSLENARYSLQEAENNLENLRFNFLQELGFARRKSWLSGIIPATWRAKEQGRSPPGGIPGPG